MELRTHPDRPQGPVYFLSDAHIGTGTGEEERIKESRLLALFDLIEREAAALVLLGDLFDFWFEYRHAIPVRGFEVVVRLRRLVQSGLPVDFLGGNHDFWAGSFLRSRVGLVTHDGPIDLECQGRKLFVAHGDGLAPGDLGYRIIRRILRNRLAIAAYRWIHPDIGIPVATSSSRISRTATEDNPVVVERLLRSIAEPQFRRGRDLVIIGHFHRAEHVRLDGRDFLINGDWMTHWTYSVLTEGHIELRRWPEGLVLHKMH